MGKFTAITIILLILLTVRVLGQFSNVILGDLVLTVFSLIFASIYVIALIGIFLRKKWGVIVVVIISVLDIISVAITGIGGAYAFGAIGVDLVLLFLAYKEYTRLGSRKSK